MKQKVAFVIQRYGKEVIGGAESLCRAVAERLVGLYDIEILTTCALDYYDWKNHFAEGPTTENSVRVRRFPVAGFRQHRRLQEFSDRIYSQPHTLREERDWLDSQGPLCPGLLAYLEGARSDFASVVFYSYLYATTVDGLAVAPERSILVPTAHDEPPLHLSIFRTVFHLPRTILYNTEQEKALARRVFQNQHVPSEVVGMGIDAAEIAPDTAHDDRFFLYLGRVDAHKGVQELIDWFNPSGNPDWKLVIAGPLVGPVRSGPGVRAVGQVSEREKNELLKRCRALIVPSQVESLSLVALEAWARGKPVVAHRGSAVMEEHIQSGQGGLLYEDSASLQAGLERLGSDPHLARQLGQQGRNYVIRKYSWNRVIQSYQDAIEKVAFKRSDERG